MSDDFRKLDVDQYDDEVLRPQDLAAVDPRPASELVRAAQAKQTSVRGKVAGGDVGGALAELLTDPPYGAAADEARRIHFALLLGIVNATRTSDITGALQGLSVTQRDNLMKYLYKGLELGGTSGGAAQGVNCTTLLQWHGKVCPGTSDAAADQQLTQAAGTGSVVRVMTDRREF